MNRPGPSSRAANRPDPSKLVANRADPSRLVVNKPDPSSRVANGPDPSKLIRTRCIPACVRACACACFPQLRVSVVGGGEVEPHDARAARSATDGGADDLLSMEQCQHMLAL